ncbi:putative NAGC-like transcriptional regulator [Klebsiella pneumoniae]|uniref:Putative NAGC-like transcriptional regulator n=1 Tax=Klebsiella pneumoniae TaxID=573 RepID=A0A3S4IV08_KLEPN|nr:putative NAGC-like transcriptional regulator [Klebsiella pneumoniae]
MRLVGEGDEKAELALSRYEQRLAKSLAHVVNILDPDVIVLGGGMSNVETTVSDGAGPGEAVGLRRRV